MNNNWHTHTLDARPEPTDLLGKQWLLTNGTGGYAMGTAAGANTNRYHGLLVAATQPPVGRIVLLNQMFEQLVLHPKGDDQAQQVLEFSTCLFDGEHGQRIFAPNGQSMLTHFARGLNVAWTYAWGDVTLTRTLTLHWKEQAATLHYQMTGIDAADSKGTLLLNPMITLRDFHAMAKADEIGGFSQDRGKGKFTVARGDLAVTFACKGASIEDRDHWWYDIQYPIDAERGQGDREDYYIPAAFRIDLPKPNGEGVIDVAFTVALGQKAAKPQLEAAQRAAHLEPMIKRLSHGTSSSLTVESEGKSKPSHKPIAGALAIAADDFVVDRTVHGRKLSTIIAGYPWFADWGRDTFIALRGLLLTTGRHEEAKAVLAAFAESIKDGLVPNRFDDYDQDAAHYNTVDASLWFVQAAMDYVRNANDKKAWNDWLAPACVSIIDAYAAGTGPQQADGKPMIFMDEDGLISAGNHHTQLTWMDAACNGTVFTPRPGKAVEINALWHNALVGLSELLPKALSEQAANYKKLAAQAKRSFNKLFWDDEKGYLADHVNEDGGQAHHDWSFRPNQIFACALEHTPLAQTKQKKVIAAVRDRLLTPVGLRTLPTDDPSYHAHYAGEQYHRDEAYHQGTIWPWLIGPFAEAVARSGKLSAKARSQAIKVIAPLLSSLVDAPLHTNGGDAIETEAATVGSVGQLAEIHEAQPPHRPVGCMAQAWSVAEVLRLYAMLNSAPKPASKKKHKAKK